MDSLIRWKRTDSERLTKAINRFNRVRSEMSGQGFDLPDRANYNKLRDHIDSRKELDAVIDTLNSFTERTVKEEVKLASGEKISLFDYNEALRRKEVAERNLYAEMNKMQKERAMTENKYMGEERITEIQETIESLQDTFKSKESLKRMQNRLSFIGREDYSLAKNKLFRDNFMKSLDNIKNFDNYDVLKKELNKIKNPNKFYDFVKKSPVLMDIFLWYKEDDGSLVYSTFDTNEQAFNYALQNDLDLPIELD